ncbi:MAG TPA: replication initiation factor domain-containing protein [Bacilli bacterium]
MDRQESLVCLIDWLNVTVKTQKLSDIFEILGIEQKEFSEMPKGMFGYHKQIACGEIKVLYEGTASMGIHIQFSGQGCRQYETYYDGDWMKLLDNLKNKCAASFSRFDLAVDEIRYNNDKPYFRVKQLIRKAKRGEARTKWKKGRDINEFEFGDGTEKGSTLYCGSPQSMLQLRFYEKDEERLQAGKELQEGLTTWNRMEFQLRDDRADDAIEWMLSGFTPGDLMFGILSNYINFVDKNDDQNKARWPICEWWLEFLNGAGKLRLTRKAPDKTIDDKKTWIDKQVKPTLAEVWVAEGYPGDDFFVDLMNEGMARMTEKQWSRAEEYKRETDSKKMTTEERKPRTKRYLEETEERIRDYRENKRKQLDTASLDEDSGLIGFPKKRQIMLAINRVQA